MVETVWLGSSSYTSDSEFSFEDSEDSILSSESSQNIQSTINPTSVEGSKIACEAGPLSQKWAKRQFITTKLVTIMVKCKISDRDATHLLIATSETLKHKFDGLIINRSSTHWIRDNLLKEWAIQLRTGLQIANIFEKLVIHWNEKMLLLLTGKDLVDRLLVIILYKRHGLITLDGYPRQYTFLKFLFFETSFT